MVINAGSSSVKYQLFDMGNESVLASGEVERIGTENSGHRYGWLMPSGEWQSRHTTQAITDHHQALEQVMTQLTGCGILRDMDSLTAIGHRVVHGGETFTSPVVIDEDVIAAIREMIPLAPLHNPANLEGIQVTRQLCQTVPQVAVFDTAFHQTMPAQAYHYALPSEYYQQHKVRRYGFHGTSHHYVAKQAAAFLGKDLDKLNLITLHLGNGCSATAIQAGHSIDTSMGMTPLEGLVMGTRCGDIDPALHFYLMREMNLSAEQLEQTLNKSSGLKGLCGSSDMREVKAAAESGHTAALLARQLFAYRIKKYIGSYLAVLGHVDAIIFTGGIGEHDTPLREQICEGLSGLGIQIDSCPNSSEGTIQPLHTAQSKIKILVIPTNEELEIARSALALIDSEAS
ncbi:MAG: acetate kinase [Sedimenticola sp.]|nr:acetate kinase [Sedimenticola sp.]